MHNKCISVFKKCFYVSVHMCYLGLHVNNFWLLFFTYKSVSIKRFLFSEVDFSVISVNLFTVTSSVHTAYHIKCNSMLIEYF